MLAGALASCVHQDVGTVEPLAKCGRVHGGLQDDLERPLHLGEGEFCPQQMQRQGAVTALDAQPLQPHGDQLAVIEGELQAGQIVQRMPATAHRPPIGIRQTEIDEGGGPAAGIPLQVAEGTDLLAVAVLQPPLCQQAMASRVQIPIPGLVDAQGRQLPAVGKGGAIPGLEKQLEPLLAQPQHHHIQTHSRHPGRPARLLIMFGR